MVNYVGFRVYDPTCVQYGKIVKHWTTGKLDIQWDNGAASSRHINEVVVIGR